MNLKLFRTNMDMALTNPYFESNPFPELHWRSRRFRVFARWCISERLNFWPAWINERTKESHHADKV